MGKTKAFILLEALIAMVIGVSMVGMLYMLLAQASVYHGRAVQLFAATHDAVNAVHYARAHARSALHIPDGRVSLVVQQHVLDGVARVVVQARWRTAGHDEFLQLQYCEGGP